MAELTIECHEADTKNFLSSQPIQIHTLYKLRHLFKVFSPKQQVRNVLNETFSLIKTIFLLQNGQKSFEILKCPHPFPLQDINQYAIYDSSDCYKACRLVILAHDGRLQHFIHMFLGLMMLEQCDGALDVVFQALIIGVFCCLLILLDGFLQHALLHELVGLVEALVAGQHIITHFSKMIVLTDYQMINKPDRIGHHSIIMSSLLLGLNSQFLRHFIISIKDKITKMSQEQCQAESLVQVDGCYEVAAILDKKVMKKDGKLKTFYLIYWKGYPNECDHTWEPPENLKAVKDMIYEFEKRRRANPVKEENNKESLDLKKPKQTQLPEDSENSKQKGETKDSESVPQKQRKLRKLQVSSPNKQQTDKNNLISVHSEKKNEVKKKLEGKRNTNTKNEQKQTNKQASRKRTNPFLQQQQQQSIHDAPPQQPVQKPQPSKYGSIVNHFYQSGEIYYEVQMLSKQGSVKGTAVLVAPKIKDECSSKIADYLEKYIIELEEWNRQLQP